MKKEFSYITPAYSAQVIMDVETDYNDEEIIVELVEIYGEEGERPSDFESFCEEFMHETVYNGGLVDINKNRDYIEENEL